MSTYDSTTIERARQLAAELTAEAAGRVQVMVEEHGADAQIVFTGGPQGDHGLWLSVSSERRILTHFDGYLTNVEEAAYAAAS